MAIIMKRFLKDFYLLNKKIAKDFKYRNSIIHKSGVSKVERERLLNFEPFKVGIAEFFESEFMFSHGPSFVHSADEILGEDIYKFIPSSEQPYIIDCGTNIGLSLYYFKKFYPKAKILAFEPDEKIFEILEKNLQNLPNNKDVIIEKKAVWTENTQLEFFSEGALAGSLITDFGHKNNIIKIDAVSLKEYLNEPVDFLKIDIEGAENEVIFDLKGHLSQVKNLFLEYHGIKESKQNLGDILNLLTEEGFEYYIRLAGETLRFPFLGEEPKVYNQQLNILCYRKQGI